MSSGDNIEPEGSVNYSSEERVDDLHRDSIGAMSASSRKKSVAVTEGS